LPEEAALIDAVAVAPLVAAALMEGLGLGRKEIAVVV